jgi:16S rRNA (cytosine967-C5)-methyltransferase
MSEGLNEENVIPRYEGSYSRTASTIIETYKGELPLSHFLKKFFAANKKHGSRDRKQIAALCYDHYRKAAPEKLNSLKDEFSESIDPDKFSNSFSVQPDLFIRIRPGNENIVISKLKNAAMNYEPLTMNCISLSNSSKIDPILELDKEAVIQDANSQRVLDHLSEIDHSEKKLLWDCCAASGGKSILAYDLLKGNVDITVSDIRENILANLKKRFTAAGIKNYRSFIADLSLPTANRPLPTAPSLSNSLKGEPPTAHRPLPTEPSPSNSLKGEPPTANRPLPTPPSPSNSLKGEPPTPDSGLPTPDFLICDAPCTGSGTWARTPEQLFFFKSSTIGEYAQKQKQIVSNAVPQLKKGGFFYYITCSVFKKENEEVVDFIKENFDLELVQLKNLIGYNMKADSMFVSVFKKP